MVSISKITSDLGDKNEPANFLLMRQEFSRPSNESTEVCSSKESRLGRFRLEIRFENGKIQIKKC